MGYRQSAFALAAGLFGLLSAAYGSTVVPTQLEGLKTVGVSVEIACDSQTLAEKLRGGLAAVAREAVADLGVSIDDSAAAWLTVSVTCGRVQAGALPDGAWQSASVLVEVSEPVRLVRDPALKVAGGGAVTWMMDGIASGAGEQELGQEVLSVAGSMLDQFHSGYRQANSWKGAP